MKLGLIGGGYWGQNLIRDFNSLGVLHTICEVNENLIVQYKNKYPTVITTKSWDDVLNNNEITAVCISLPAEMHYKFAKEALLANKDVYVEKPITLDIKEAEELVQLSKKQNKILMVGHLLQYHVCIETIKEIINSNQVGKIKSITSNRLSLGKFRTAENVLWSFAPHDISVILSLCNDELPSYVSCHGQSIVTPNIQDIVNTTMHFANQNIYVNVNVNWLSPYKEQKLTIVGDEGILLFDDVEPTNKLKLFRNYVDKSNGNPQSVKKEEVISIDTSKSPLVRECEYFVNCCLTRQTPRTDGGEGVRVLKVLDMLQKSLNTNTNNKINKYFAHETAIVDSGANIGDKTKIWHFSHISSNCQIGDNCNIGQNVFVAPHSKLGNNCKVQNNVSVYSGVECGDNVFLGPSCVLTNDINPRCEHSKGGNYMKTVIEDGVTIGANATIVCGHKIGKYALVGAGAVVTKDVEPYSIVVGNPAKKIGTIDEYGNRTLLLN